MTEFIVPRRATCLRAEPPARETRPLPDWRALDAYVLLGDPGAGKTKALKAACDAEGGLWMEACNVVAGVVPDDLAGRTVFIDALDEVRAGATDRRAPFNIIRKWLFDRGCPRFRLSCREADWLGENDAKRLEEVAPSRQVVVLHLDPLDQEEILQILDHRPAEVPDARAFLQRIEQAGLVDLLNNPLLLDLLIRSMTSAAAPRTRCGIYEAAVRQLALEYNEEHRNVKLPSEADTLALVDDAGVLCAALLLSGRRGVAIRAGSGADALRVDDLAALALRNAHAALASKLFTVDGDVAVPRHRTLAEYLGARALAQRIPTPLPLGRVMALMQGIDGAPVEPLRGLWAWLAVHHAPGRQRLIDADPFGFVLNGDAAALHLEERVGVLRGLQKAFDQDPWLRRDVWASHPFGPLATADLVDTYAELLRNPRRDRGHFAFVDCLFDALQYGQPIPALRPLLQSWIEDGSVPSQLRTAAYEAWKRCTGGDDAQAMAWLQAIQRQEVPDSDDEMLGVLLRDLYPAQVPPDQLFGYWHVPRVRDLYGAYKSFWSTLLWKQTPHDSFGVLIAGWLHRRTVVGVTTSPDHQMEAFLSQMLAAALQHQGDSVPDETLYEWLGLCLDEHGFSRVEDRQSEVRDWLAARPARMKAVVALGLRQVEADAEGHWRFWPAESRLHGAQKPRDWFYWLLDQAASAPNKEMARYCFVPPAHAAISPVPGIDCPSMEYIESWMARYEEKWPDTGTWLEGIWWMPLDHWQADHERRNKKAAAEQMARDERRRRDLAPAIPSLLDGSASAQLLHHVAVAHEHGFSDIQGQTPLERVANLLMCDESVAQAVIDALPRVLDRADVPSVDEVISLEQKGRQPYLRSPALLAAKLIHGSDGSAALTWSLSLVERLVACYLTDGTGDMPGWYRMLVRHRPDWVAPVLLRYAKAKLRRRGQQSITAIWALSREADHAALARLVLPGLLDAVPHKASEPVRGILNRSLLPALVLLEGPQAADLIRSRLSVGEMDAAQRICWLVADLPHRAEAAEKLAALVGRNERRAVILGAALYEQGTLGRVGQPLMPLAIQHLIEVLGPITSPDAWLQGGFVTEAHERSRTVQSLFAALSSDTREESRTVLRALMDNPALRKWHDHARFNLRAQVQAARESSFKVPSPEEVAQALANRQPANAADLRALVIDQLSDLQAQWRGRDSFRLGLFWKDPAKTPKIENECRDLLLNELLPRFMPMNMALTPERMAAQAKRADLCIEYLRDGRRIALPVELKKQNHENLWTAWRDQLDRLYTVDPDAAGLGLYLVLWFGVLKGKERMRTHPEGLRIDSADALKAALVQHIPPQDRYSLAVHVLDLSWPTPP